VDLGWNLQTLVAVIVLAVIGWILPLDAAFPPVDPSDSDAVLRRRLVHVAFVVIAGLLGLSRGGMVFEPPDR
jgi:hypothetical protein